MKVKSSGMSVCMLKADCQLPITSKKFLLLNVIHEIIWIHLNMFVMSHNFNLYMAPKKLPCKTLYVHSAK